MNITETTLTLSDCARALGVPRVALTFTAQLYSWPGRQPGGHWRVPASWFKDQFSLSEDQIFKGKRQKVEQP
jgi:hypothetical protein